MTITNIFDQINSEIKKILKKALDSEELSKSEALELLKVTGKEFLALQQVANHVCFEKKEDIVTFIINRNINFTNVCYKRCKFCSFSVSKMDDDAFLLSIEDIKEKVVESDKNNCSEVCVQGGINPDLNFEYYLEILKTVKKVNEHIHIHAFSPQEVFYMSKLFGNSVETTLKELKNAGLDSMPGTAAEILVDKIRKVICPNKVSVPQWVEIISTAHEVGIPTTSTIMYGHIEELQDRIEHLNVIREIQKETQGFTEFVPLPFIKDNPILSKITENPLKPTYGMDDLKLFSVARLFFNNQIENIQCSWVKLGPNFAQVSLNSGVNDFSGTLFEEHISKSAGATHGEYLTPYEIKSIIRSAGKRPAQRDTLYNILEYY